MSEKNIVDPLKDIRSSFQSLHKQLKNTDSPFQSLHKQLKNTDSPFQSLHKQLDNSCNLPKITMNSDLLRLVGAYKRLEDPYRLKEIIGKSPLVEYTKISKQFAEFIKIRNQFPDLSTQLIPPTLPSINFPNIIIPSSSVHSIWPLTPVERRTPPLQTDTTSITDEVYEQRIPLEEHRVPSPQPTPIEISQKILIVGGFADGSNQIVARFIENLGFEAIILSEQPTGGRTKFEKFEAYTNVDFAITLLTPDDIGKVKDSPGKLKPRPSQDTIFQLSYLCKHLRVSIYGVNKCSLYTQKKLNCHLILKIGYMYIWVVATVGN